MAEILFVGLVLFMYLHYIWHLWRYHDTDKQGRSVYEEFKRKYG
jgi:hypothetical protein